jgi:hypothetical protein
MRTASLEGASMSSTPARSNARRQRWGSWSRLASRALVRALGGAPPALVEPPPPPQRPIVGVKKSAVYRDAQGGLRQIDLFLPADVVIALPRPLDIKFLDGDEPVTAEEIGRAVWSSFTRMRDAS